MSLKPSSQGNVPDPEIQSAGEFQYYVQRHGIKRDYSKPTHAELVNDVNVLHSFTKKLVKEKDRMQQTIRWDHICIRVLATIVSLELTLLLWFASELLKRL